MPMGIWLDAVINTMGSNMFMCGQLLTCALQGDQDKWIRMQPWYAGKTPANPTTFVAGGWFTIEITAIEKLDWPPTNIIHRGGDQMLGEACRQNDFELCSFTAGLGINSDDGQYGTAKRRGWNPLPVGVKYNPSLTQTIHDATQSIPLELLDYPNI
jgi:hypothetical protein